MRFLKQTADKWTHWMITGIPLMYRAYAMVLLILIITFLSGFFYTSVLAREGETPNQYKYFTSIEVKSGDTLWSIACQYMNEDYETVQDYIDELKYMNRLSSDQITEGHYLTITYFSEEYK